MIRTVPGTKMSASAISILSRSITKTAVRPVSADFNALGKSVAMPA
jgi:hypothetical protein